MKKTYSTIALLIGGAFIAYKLWSKKQTQSEHVVPVLIEIGKATNGQTPVRFTYADGATEIKYLLSESDVQSVVKYAEDNHIKYRTGVTFSVVGDGGKEEK